jgi:hypothetical protein
VPLLGKAALAMWWEVAPGVRTEFEDWHSHEHFPERLSIPGFVRGSRWTGTMDVGSYFVMYELDAYGTLTSPHYLARLNHPTRWSIKMMPHHLGMVRSQCRVVESYGSAIARSMLTIRICPDDGRTELLRSRLRQLLGEIPSQAGLTGGHLLLTDTPNSGKTTEQKIRRSDAVADWIVLISGYDAHALRELTAHEFAAPMLVHAGATQEQTIGLYDLAYTMTAQDLRA